MRTRSRSCGRFILFNLNFAHLCCVNLIHVRIYKIYIMLGAAADACVSAYADNIYLSGRDRWLSAPSSLHFTSTFLSTGSVGREEKNTHVALKHSVSKHSDVALVCAEA